MINKMNKPIGIIGFGNMGQAVAEQLKSKYQVWVFDKDKNKTRNLTDINTSKNILDLLGKAEVLILAVKPQDFAALLGGIKDHAKEKLVISIAAGINIKYIEEILGNARVIRAMPNIGVKIGESVTCFSVGKSVSSDDLSFANELFNHLGVTRNMKEEMMNGVTAISGSGPACIFDFIETNSIEPDNVPEGIKRNLIERLIKAAQVIGFSPEDAKFLAVNTSNTSINLMSRTGLSPAELKRQVTSKGGTTIAALEVLHRGGSWEEAAQAAKKRAEELSKKE